MHSINWLVNYIITGAYLIIINILVDFNKRTTIKSNFLLVALFFF
jgi:hypothetical protein